MTKAALIRFTIAIVLAGIANDTIHIYYGHIVSDVTIYKPFINHMSFLTKSLEALGAGIVYYLLYDRLYFKSLIIKTFILAILVCLIKDGFIRQPFMNILLGNSVIDSFYRESQVWLSSLAMSFVLTFIIRPKIS